MADYSKLRWAVWEPLTDRFSPWEGAIAIVVDEEYSPEHPSTVICWFTRGWDSKHAAQEICDAHNNRLDEGKPLKVSPEDMAQSYNYKEWIAGWSVYAL